jgi:hypothetical protein
MYFHEVGINGRINPEDPCQHGNNGCTYKDPLVLFVGQQHVIWKLRKIEFKPSYDEFYCDVPSTIGILYVALKVTWVVMHDPFFFFHRARKPKRML